MATLTPQAPTTLSTSSTPLPTPEQVANRQLALNASGNVPTTQYPTSSSSVPTAQLNDQAASQLGAYLSGGTLTPAESAQENTIMGRFKAAQAGTTQQYQSLAQGLGNDYSNQLSNLNRELGNESNATTESRSGFATNTAILRNLQESGQFRVDQLTKQRDTALLNNNASMANSLNELIMNEQNLITQSRQNMASNLGTAATLETPGEKVQLALQQAQQAAVVQLQSQAPDANISSNDTYDQAIAKFRNSKYYQNNIHQAEATIANIHAQTAAAAASATASSAQAGLAGAQSGLAGAQTTQTKTLTGMVNGSPASQPDPVDVQNYKDGKLTIDDLHKKYDGISYLGVPVGAQKIAATITAAQQQGANPVSLQNSADAQAANARNLGGGGYGAATTAFTNALGGFFGGAFGSNPLTVGGSTPSTTGRTLGPANSVTMTGPKGTFTVTADKVSTMQKNGYTITH